MCSRLTGQGTAKDLQPHTQRAVPALRDDSHVTGQYRLCQLVHHWSVFITVSEEQLGTREKTKKSESGKEEGDIIACGTEGRDIILRELTQSVYPSWMVVHSRLSLLKARK